MSTAVFFCAFFLVVVGGCVQGARWTFCAGVALSAGVALFAGIALRAGEIAMLAIFFADLITLAALQTQRKWRVITARLLLKNDLRSRRGNKSRTFVFTISQTQR